MLLPEIPESGLYYIFTLLLGAVPDGLALDFVRDRVYITDAELRTISYFSKATRQLTTVVPLASGARPRDIVLDNTQRYIFYFNLT